MLLDIKFETQNKKGQKACGGLNKNGPHRLIYVDAIPQGVALLEWD